MYLSRHARACRGTQRVPQRHLRHCLPWRQAGEGPQLLCDEPRAHMPSALPVWPCLKVMADKTDGRSDGGPIVRRASALARSRSVREPSSVLCRSGCRQVDLRESGCGVICAHLAIQERVGTDFHASIGVAGSSTFTAPAPLRGRAPDPQSDFSRPPGGGEDPCHAQVCHAQVVRDWPFQCIIAMFCR